MSSRYHITNAFIVNEGKIFKGEVLISDGRIMKVLHEHEHYRPYDADPYMIRINARGRYILPGVIDDQVHFREPGLTHKADIHSESMAAVAGGVTSFMDMPNTIPQTLTQERLKEKYAIGAEKSMANYSFYMGASNDNIDEILKTDPSSVCGVKVFMGASTGNMLVDDKETLKEIFSRSPLLVAVHCEEEEVIKRNAKVFREQYGEDVPFSAHPLIRSEEACYISSSKAVAMAREHGTRLHVLHLSTAEEMVLFDDDIPLADKKITAEVCVHHLWFSDNDYEKMGTLIKWNPAIKTRSDREALWQALEEDRIDVIATDHAPHTLDEKESSYFKAPSGGPLVQHSLPAMLDKYHEGKISLEKIVEKMCHNPAIAFNVEDRGFIREGSFADLVLVDLDQPWTVEPSNILYKCGWSPFDGHTFKSKITHTFVSGNLTYEATPDILDAQFARDVRGMRLTFNR